MLIQDLKENEWDKVHIFQAIYFENFQIHQLTIIHCFEHINHDIFPNVLFQNLYKLILHARNLRQ